MEGEITIEANWDAEAGVWRATSPQVPGLAVEAKAWMDVFEEVDRAMAKLKEPPTK
jgi:Domain of unknown function (DUF1902)